MVWVCPKLLVQAGCSISPLFPVALFDVMAHTSGVPEPFSWERSGVLDWDAIGGVAGDPAGSGSEKDDGAVFFDALLRKLASSL